jgi:alkylation response protein AidB-like acyl-CoA dehydrogenase
MHFAPTEEQADFAQATRSVLVRMSNSSAVRAAWQTGRPPASLWGALADLGLLTLLAPEPLGGGSELELIAALEEVGRAAAPGPIIETAAVAVPLLAVFAPDLLADDDLLAGGITATTSEVMPHLGAGAGLLLETDRIGLVDLGGVQPLEALDASRMVGRLGEDRRQAAQTIAAGPEAGRQVALARDRAAAATASVLLGLSARAVEMTVEYTSARHQFGVPVGSFQAVKHHVASAHVAIEMARPLTEAASWALSAGAAEASRLCSMAKVTANQAARRTAKAALQCHGAIGYTMEADLHLYLMRIWSLLNAWGTTEDHLSRVSASLSLPALAS